MTFTAHLPASPVPSSRRRDCGRSGSYEVHSAIVFFLLSDSGEAHRSWRFRNGPGGVKSPVSTPPSIGAPRLSITSVVVAGLLLPSVVGTQAATSCHQKKR